MSTLLLLLILAFNQYRIGKFNYEVEYRSDSLGEIQFPLDDATGKRKLILPIDLQQQKFSFKHEIVHACLHDHEHHFKTKEELQAHIDYFRYTNEESVATVIGVCLAESSYEVLSGNPR